MRRIALIWSLLLLTACQTQNQVILNVDYVLQPNTVLIYKEYENQIYKWEFDYGNINILKLDHYIYRDMIPTNYQLSTERDYYTCYTIFYNYGKTAALIC